MQKERALINWSEWNWGRHETHTHSGINYGMCVVTSPLSISRHLIGRRQWSVSSQSLSLCGSVMRWGVGGFVSLHHIVLLLNFVSLELMSAEFRVCVWWDMKADAADTKRPLLCNISLKFQHRKTGIKWEALMFSAHILRFPCLK